MIYPKDILELLGKDQTLAERFPTLAGSTTPHTGAAPVGEDDYRFEEWMRGEGYEFAPVQRYLSFLDTMQQVTLAIWRDFPRGNPGHETEKDGNTVQSSHLEMMHIARYLYYLDSYGVGGDLLECGCFFGFSSSCLSWACHLLGRRLIVADSFRGLPHEEVHDSVRYRRNDFEADFDTVRGNIARFGRMERVDFVPGWFSESLPGFSRPIALLWMDVDLESSARDVLESAFAQLQPQGVVFSHEFGPKHIHKGMLQSRFGPTKAIHAFLTGQGISYRGCHVFGETGLVVPQTEQLPLLRHSRLMYLLNGLREQEKAAPVRLAQWQKELRLVGTNVAALELRWPDLLSRLDHMEYFDILYNTASAQIDLGNVGVAKSLFTAIAELLREQNPELAGKALYKLAMLAEGERNDLLDSCLNAYPEHGAARARRHGTAGA